MVEKVWYVPACVEWNGKSSVIGLDLPEPVASLKDAVEDAVPVELGIFRVTFKDGVLDDRMRVEMIDHSLDVRPVGLGLAVPKYRVPLKTRHVLSVVAKGA